MKILGINQKQILVLQAFMWLSVFPVWAQDVVPVVEEVPAIFQIQEQDNAFTLSVNERAQLIIANSKGQILVIQNNYAYLRSEADFEIVDGILSVKEAAREIDLRNFDAEISFIGDTKNSISTAVFKEVDSNYPDQVYKERKKILAGQSVELTQSESETALRIGKILKTGKSVGLLGASGSGKSAEIKNLVRMIARGAIPGIPRTAEVREIKLSNLQAGTMFVGTMEEKIETILAYSRALKPIIIIDEFHAAEGAGVSMGNPSNILQSLKGPLEDGELRMVGISTDTEWQNAFGNDMAIDRRFIKVQHTPAAGEQLTKIIQDSFVLQGKPVPSVLVIQEAIRLSNQFAVTGVQPGISMSLLEQAQSLVEEVAGNWSASALEDVQKAAVQAYRIDPVYFSKQKVFERVVGYKQWIEQEIVGQKSGVQAMSTLILKKLTGVGSDKSANLIIFAGPPGVGKTLISEKTGEYMGYHVHRINMGDYALPYDVESFKAEVYNALKKSPLAVIILDEIEKAHKTVQAAILPMAGSGNFTVNFKDNAGRLVFAEVKSSNALFLATTNAGQHLMQKKRTPVGFSAAIATMSAPDDHSLRQALIEGNIIEPLVSRSETVSLLLPSAEEFKLILNRTVNGTLARESAKSGVQFTLANQPELVDAMMKEYVSQVTDNRLANVLVKNYLEPYIAQAMISSAQHKEKSCDSLEK